MENTLENKAKFFAQYWGQKVLMHSLTQKSPHTNNWGKSVNAKDFLELKPLSAISDEDKNKISINGAIHVDENGYSFSMTMGIYDSIDFTHDQIDDLRAMGYLVGWRGLTTKGILARGWAVLEQPETN